MLSVYLYLTLGSRDDGQWSDPKVEPIWITATKQVFTIYRITTFIRRVFS